MSEIERAAEVLRLAPKWNGTRFDPLSPMEAAEALGAAGLLVTDADRAVLDAADELERSHLAFDEGLHWHTPKLCDEPLCAAVRARREADQ